MSTEIPEYFDSGVVIGKFLPPHAGHHFLISTALVRCRLVTVIVCGKPSDPIPGPLRTAWLQEIHPAARVMLIDDRYDENDSAVWARHTMQWLGQAPAAVFTSEDYGDRYASLMGAHHVMVDRERRHFPCSGTAVRNDPMALWDFLTPPVRSWFARRVCVLGAESTGTTTLARTLADHYQTSWVPEFGREYSAAKQAANDASWHSSEFAEIATEQSRREDLAARLANRLLICDTNAFATRLWHRRYMGSDSEAVDRMAAAASCDLYLLTGDEIPFVQDGLRDGEHLRHQMHQWFVAALEAQSVKWILLRGTPEARLAAAVAAISSTLGLEPPATPAHGLTSEAYHLRTP